MSSGKMKPVLPILAAAALLFLAACQQQPLLQVESEPLGARSGVSLEQVAAAIIQAGAENDWTITEVESGRLRGQIRMKLGKHSAVVQIKHDTKTFSILYDSSHQLNYRAFPEVTYIHPAYNSAVEDLRQSIQKFAAAL